MLSLVGAASIGASWSGLIDDSRAAMKPGAFEERRVELSSQLLSVTAMTLSRIPDMLYGNFSFTGGADDREGSADVCSF